MVGAVRSALTTDEGFTALVPAERVVTRKPADVTTIYAQVQMVGNYPLHAAAKAYSPLVQVAAWLPIETPGVDAETVAFAAAAKAADVLSTQRALTWQGAGFNLRVVDGPMPAWDDSRSGSAGLAGALIRVELRVHA